ncbi:YybH family protein [Spirosoma foliorum]|uniref:Nuclear transport factor 2 family protein n=1 Tax=Spirosoma foliorum TaxID=2710596 RepID=A0A7G5H3M1_9BACT|nr:nuclear transport factor 2 family protein [Spirosoma foliorum]QMW05713.1 nuclear transport factor 2 family protein [Spirosoma foliorum]
MNRTQITCLLIGLFLLSFGSFAQTKPVESTDIVAIKSLRTQSNQAIQARDLTAFGQTMLPDIEVTRGSGSHVSGRDSVLASVSVQFKDPNFLGYVRNTDQIQVSTTSPLAAENGHWTGRFQRPDGIQTITGVYLAMWRKTESGWKIRSELFVSLACTGSAACGK